MYVVVGDTILERRASERGGYDSSPVQINILCTVLIHPSQLHTEYSVSLVRIRIRILLGQMDKRNGPTKHYEYVALIEFTG